MMRVLTTKPGAAASLISAALIVCTAAPAAASTSKLEMTCASRLARSTVRLSSTVLKREGRCRLELALGEVASCPSNSSAEKVSAAAEKIADAADKFCFSTCSVSSSQTCVATALCPPLGSARESCSAGLAAKTFDVANLGFPGPYCEQILGRRILEPTDIATCVSTIAEEASQAFVDAVYGALDGTPAISKAGARCLSAAADAAGKLSATVFKGVSKCRDLINKGKLSINPTTCLADYGKIQKKIAKVEGKVAATIEKRCPAAALAELDLCNAGAGATTTVEDATDCLTAVAYEVTDTQLVPSQRVYSPRSLIDAAYPPAPVCGDDQVNQLSHPFLLLGEECDGLDDSACPGACFPPGDLFECSCATIPRVRFFASAVGSETDAGWTGLSHNQVTAQDSGFISSLDNCDCDEFDEASCIGSSSDPVCDVAGDQLPVCSSNPSLKLRCDQQGNVDGEDADDDCYVCDEYSANAGEFCINEGDCLSHCYAVDGDMKGPCTMQSDCAPGQVCRGQCDRTPHCIVTPNGAPQPVSTGTAPVCVINHFRTDVSGTRNIVTGEHEISYKLLTKIHTGENPARPCPVCGGFCVGGLNDRGVCEGSCALDATPCRFDTDCSAGDHCTSASPDCPGGHCELSLVCGASPTVQPGLTGKPCRITSEDAQFGTVSNDCMPFPGANTTGDGLKVDYLPQTSGSLSLASNFPCTAGGFELYDCPCPSTGAGEPTRPNSCAPACNDGINAGLGCADGNSAGAGTVCAGGLNAGRNCDDDGDCPGSACSSNPFHCEGDPAYDRFSCTLTPICSATCNLSGAPCTVNADCPEPEICGIGANVCMNNLAVPCGVNADCLDVECGSGACVDACPGGRCVPLCIPSDADPYDGVCAAGPEVYHCSDGRFTKRSCSAGAVGAGCSATCSKSATPCLAQADCPTGEVCSGPCPGRQDCEAGADGELGTGDDLIGAGSCMAGERSCFLDPITAEGGSTLNGEADPTNYSTVGIWCFTANNNPGVNNGAGFPGPARVRVRGVNVPNFTVIP